MTPTKTLYLNEVRTFAETSKYVVDKDGTFLMVNDGGDENVLVQEEDDVFLVELIGDWDNKIENIKTIQVVDELVTFTYGGYTFEKVDNSHYKVSEIPPEFVGTGELVSHNFGVDEAYLCDKSNNVVWATLGGQKVYFEQSAIGEFSTASTKPQTAAEMGLPAIESSQNVNFMLFGYVFILESVNTYASYPVPPTNN